MIGMRVRPVLSMAGEVICWRGVDASEMTVELNAIESNAMLE
jgi:hypothetical protein